MWRATVPSFTNVLHGSPLYNCSYIIHSPFGKVSHLVNKKQKKNAAFNLASFYFIWAFLPDKGKKNLTVPYKGPLLAINSGAAALRR